MSDATDTLPVLTIGGYLGAGKTTLVNYLLRNAGGRRLAVLVNEFGELPIDEDLIEAQDDALLSIAGGCICCSFGNDLIGALKDMAGMSPQPDVVVIESSGVAIPGAIVSTLSLLDGFRSDGIVVLVDAETVCAAAGDEYLGDTILRQLEDAEIVVLNKLDLVSSKKRAEVERWLEQHAQNAAIVPTDHGKVAPEALLGVVDTPCSGHDGAHADHLFESHTIVPHALVSATKLARKLATSGLGVVRAKGHMTDTDGVCWRIQNVGLRYSAEAVEQSLNPGIVCLGVAGGLNRQGIDALLANCT